MSVLTPLVDAHYNFKKGVKVLFLRMWLIRLFIAYLTFCVLILNVVYSFIVEFIRRPSHCCDLFKLHVIRFLTNFTSSHHLVAAGGGGVWGEGSILIEVKQIEFMRKGEKVFRVSVN